MKGIQCDRCKKMYPRNYNVWREESGKAHPVVHLAKITVDKLVVDKVDLCDQCQKDFDRFINEYEQWNMRKDDRENRETTVEEYEQLAMDASDGEDNTGWETVNKSFSEVMKEREEDNNA